MGFEIIMFGLGLILLVWGSSLFVDSAVMLANYLRLPEVLIGATIVSLGTTMPEILYSTMASVGGYSDMAIGNALGSILCNTGFIAGFMIILKPIYLKEKEVLNVIFGTVFLAIGFGIYIISGNLTGGLTRVTGSILLTVCILYLILSAKNNIGKKENNVQEKTYSSETTNLNKDSQQKFGFSDTIRLIMEAVAVYLGASILVEHAPKIARAIGVPEMIISLTLVALGTSLPELVTSLVALKKNHGSLSLGNIIGADVLNFLSVGGASALICPIKFPSSILMLEMPFVFILLFVMCVPVIIRKKVTRLQGATMFVAYAVYLYLIQS